ncbi:MAG: phage baseplate protein, partial [Treponema sp.]
LTAATTSHLAGFYFDGKKDRGFKVRDISKEETLKFLELTQQHIVNMIYPVGSVMLTFYEGSPAKNFPGTEWKYIAKGKYLAGIGQGEDKNGNGGIIYPNDTHNLGEYMHRLTYNEMPEHTHIVNVSNNGNPDGKRDRSSGADCQYWHTGDNNTKQRFNTTPETESAGRKSFHNNMPPYFGVFVWLRTK